MNGNLNNIIRRTFSKRNVLGVLVVSIFPVLLGMIEKYFGVHTNTGGYNETNLLLNFLYSLLVTSSIFFGCAFIIEVLNLYLPWKGNLKKRIALEVLLIFSYASLAQFLILFSLEDTAVFIRPLESGDYFSNILFGNTVTLIVVAIIEGGYFFINWKESLLAAERLKQEQLESNLSNLRAQLDPHFMFNSLNVLSSLIRKDPVKAEKFVDDFSKVYRYLLDVKNETVVPLKDELEFVEHYLRLQKIRFEDGLLLSTRIDPEHLNHYLPPLSLQEMVGNAIKHNVISTEKPLKLEIYSNGNSVRVRNNVQHRPQDVVSTGIGLKNLKERYHYICDREPRFEMSDGLYEAQLPLLKMEE